MKKFAKLFLLSVTILVSPSTHDMRAAAVAESQVGRGHCSLLAAENALLHDLPSISHAAITEAKQAIAADFARNDYKRAACTVVMGSVLAYTAYKIIEAQFGRPKASVASPAQNDLYYYPPTREEFDRLKDRFAQFQKSFDPDWFTWAWVKSWGKHIGAGFVSMAATKGLFDVSDRVIANVFHDGDLKWFIKEHTQTMEVVGELKAYTERLGDCLTPADMQQCKRQIIFVTRSLARQITVLIAFIEYKAEVAFNARASEEAAQVAQYLMVTTNEFTRSLLTKLQVFVIQDHCTLGELLNAYTNDLGHMLSSFDRIEKEQAAIA